MRKPGRGGAWAPFLLGAAIALAFSPCARAGDKPAEQDAQLQREQQMREAVQKAELAEAIVTRQEQAAERPFDPTYRNEFKAALMTLSLARLEDAAGQGELPLGESQADLVYTPVTPCRVFDTRSTAQGMIIAGTTRSFQIAGNTLGPQGGNPAGCGIPLGPATAAVVNFVVVDFQGFGDIRAWPFGQPIPAASIVNYAIPGQGLNLANAVAITMCDPATASCANDITILAEGSSTHVLGDVQGYFRNVRKEQVKSVVAKTQVSTTIPIQIICTHYSGSTSSGTVTVTAPSGVAGNVLVRADAVFIVNHTAGTEDYWQMHIGTTDTMCTTTATGTMYTRVPSPLPTATYYPTMSISGVFPVAAGSTTTFYLNGRRFTGSASFWYGAMDATFIPN